MKQIFNVFALIAAASAFFACNKDTIVEEQVHKTASNENVVTFSTTPTKSVFGTLSGTSLPTLWTDSYSVALSLNLASSKKSSTPIVSGGGTTASFTADIKDDETGDYNFYAVSPYEAVKNISFDHKSILIEIPSAQTPSSTSPDELAQILYSKQAEGSTFPTSVTMSFSHLTAYCKIGTIKNLALDPGETVQSISLTAAENWAGRYYYYAEDYSTYSAGDFAENSASNTITISTSSTTDIWFGCAPVDLGGKTIDVVITTDQGTFSKTITIPAGKKFTSGKVSSFNIDMNGITRVAPVVYTLVDDIADLTLGSEVIIVAKDSDLAMSTTQNGNNRAQAAVTKSGSTISTPGADVQVFTIENGNKAGTYAFNTGSTYIYAASSSSNYLRSEASLTNNSSWYISLAADGEATMKAVGDNTRNILQYNSGSSCFACYGSASQGAVVIYKRNGTGSGAITAKAAESLSITGATTSYSVGDPYSFDGTVSLIYTDTSTEPLTASDYTVDDSTVNMSVADTYTVTVTYNADSSVKGTYDITVASAGGGKTEYTITWNSTNNSNSVSSYTASWSVTADGLTCNMANWNNNNNGWSYVKCGRKNNASTATIITDSAISEAISSVTITIDAITAASVNSIKLYISSNGTTWTEEGSFNKNTGDQTVNIASPTANKYYKLEFDCASGSSNGLVQLSKLVFTI